MDTWDAFMEKYETASVGVKALVDSNKLPLLAENMVESGISKIPFNESVILLSDYVVGLISETALQEGLGISGSELDEILRKLDLQSNTTPEVEGVIREKLELRPEGVPRPTTTIEQAESGPKPLTREEVVSALAGKRTMASDIDAVRGSQPPRAE